MWILLVFASMFLILIMYLVAILSVIFSPLGGLMSVRKAEREELPFSMKLAITSALYSALFIFPWVYMMAGMSNRYPHRIVIQIFYVFLYATWLLGPIFLIYMGEFHIFEHGGPIPFYTRITFLIVNVSMWVISLYLLIYRRGVNTAKYIPNIVYMTPFICLFFSTIYTLFDVYIIPRFVSDWWYSNPIYDLDL